MGTDLKKQDLAQMIEEYGLQKALMKRTERRAEIASTMITAFSIYIAEQYLRSQQLLGLLLPDPEALKPEKKAQEVQRLEQLEQRLERIE